MDMHRYIFGDNDRTTHLNTHTLTDHESPNQETIITVKDLTAYLFWIVGPRLTRERNENRL